jgi:hypothetical protein
MNEPKFAEGVGVLEAAAATVHANADIRVNLAVPHLLSAAALCRRVGELEAQNAGAEFGEFWHDILANARLAPFSQLLQR